MIIIIAQQQSTYLNKTVNVTVKHWIKCIVIKCRYKRFIAIAKRMFQRNYIDTMFASRISSSSFTSQLNDDSVSPFIEELWGQIKRGKNLN